MRTVLRAGAAVGIGLALALGLGLGCDSDLPGKSGVDARLQVAGGELHPGAPPAADDGAPRVTALLYGISTVPPGYTNHRFRGRLGQGGQSLAVFLDGDIGYWMVPGGAVDILNGGEVTFDTRVSYARDLQPGTIDVRFVAVDAEGRFGAPSTAELTVIADDLSGRPLDIALDWDTEADLDLKLQLPDGTAVWSQHVNSYTPIPGDPRDPDGPANGGTLDFDSNGGCVIDGRRVEHIYWTRSPPAGTYIVRVDAASMCGQPGARWNVVVSASGTPIASSTGFLGPEATRGDHGARDGIVAVTFEAR